MKVSFGAKVRKVNHQPATIADLRKIISRKFTEKNLLDESDLGTSKMSEIVASEDSIMSFFANSKLNNSKYGKRKPQIDWTDVTLFYEDSEGDFNVISEDEDMLDAFKYADQKGHLLQASIVDKTTFKTIREEQSASDLNQSSIWLSQNPYKKEKRKKKGLPQDLKKVLAGMVDSGLEVAIEKQYNNMLRESMQQSQVEELATSVVLKFKGKMCQVTSKPDLIIKAYPGEIKQLQWTVLNASSAAWPCQPLLVNTTSGQEQVVEALLAPGESTEIRYDF